MRFNWRTYADDAYNKSRYTYEVTPPTVAVLDKQGSAFPAERTLLGHIEQRQPKRLVISGRPGSGKSFLLDRLNGKLAENLIGDMAPLTAQENDEDDVFEEYAPGSLTRVPILIRLRDLTRHAQWNQSIFDIEGWLTTDLQRYGWHQSTHEFLTNTRGVVILIDDLDEVVYGGFQENLEIVRKFLGRYPQVQAIIAGRQVATRVFDPQRELIYQLRNLSREGMQAFLNQALPDNQTTALLGKISQEEDFFSFLATPLFAKSSSNYWHTLTQHPASKSEDEFRAGRLVKYAVDDLFFEQQRIESSPQYDKSLQKRLSVLKHLALDMMVANSSIPDQALREFEQEISWCQHMEFVSQGRTTIDFTNRWVQAYFAALSILDKFPRKQDSELRNFLSGHLHPLTRVKSACLQVLEDLTGQVFLDLVMVNEETRRKFSQLEEALISSGFEHCVADYVQFELGFSIQKSYKPPFLEPDEIDILAQNERHRHHVDILIVECKYRRPPYDNKQIRSEYIEQLQRQKGKIQEHFEPVMKRQGQTVTVKAILFTNHAQLPDEMLQHIHQNGIEIHEAAYPLEDFVRRTKITKDRVRVIRKFSR